MVTSISYSMTKGGTEVADVENRCPLCTRKAHLVIKGADKIKIVQNYLRNRNVKTQDLPLNTAEREFLRSGYCRDCLEVMFSNSSSSIKYVKKGA